MTQTKPTTITATYRIVTPMFCSGMDRLQPELRPASFKGALRFWWRAAEWGRLAEYRDITRLREREDKLFGSTRTGQARFRLALRWKTSPVDSSAYVRDWPANTGTGGSAYLGYGITQSGKKQRGDFKPHREGWPTGQEIQATLRFSKMISDGEIHNVKRSLTLLGTFGGLGSRSRRAFGSLSLIGFDGEIVETNSVQAIRDSLSALTPGESRDGELPPFTAFSRHSQVAFLPAANDAFAAHDRLGTAYRNFRGQPGTLRGAVKIPLGLPLKGVDESNRRGSPLLMHIHEVGERFIPSVLFLPAHFRPNIRNSDRIEYFKVAKMWMNELNGVST